MNFLQKNRHRAITSASEKAAAFSAAAQTVEKQAGRISCSPSADCKSKIGDMRGDFACKNRSITRRNGRQGCL